MPLQDDLLALASLDRHVVRAVLEMDHKHLIPTLTEYVSLRKGIRAQLLRESVTPIEDARAIDILKQITTGDGLRTDDIIDQMVSMTDSDQMPEEFSEDELQKLGSELFYRWFSHAEYVTGLAELRPLIVRASISKNIALLVQQIKDCYAFQQYEAAYSLCRTLIEASIRDICVQCQLFPNLGDNVILFEKFNWKQLREKVSSGSLEQQLISIYSELSKVLHGRKTVSKEEARTAFEATLQVIEELYMAHGL